MTETRVWVICDSDGGRRKMNPRPMLTYVCPTYGSAVVIQNHYWHGSPLYPIREMVLRDVEGGE